MINLKSIHRSIHLGVKMALVMPDLYPQFLEEPTLLYDMLHRFFSASSQEHVGVTPSEAYGTDGVLSQGGKLSSGPIWTHNGSWLVLG